MGIQNKQYLRYIPSKSFGVIGCGKSICFLTRKKQVGKYVAVSAVDNVIIWELRRNVEVLTLNSGVKGTVTAIAARPHNKNSDDNTHIAVGYSDGSLAIFDTTVGQCVKFNGHRGGISALDWDSQGMRVASASEDGEIVVWDVMSERGIVRLLGHKGRINSLKFMSKKNILVSGGKDATVKFYDLETNNCFKTIKPQNSEVIGLEFFNEDTRLITAMSRDGLMTWKLTFNEPIKQELGAEDTNLDDDRDFLQMTDMGSILRLTDDILTGTTMNGQILSCHTKFGLIEFFYILTPDEVITKKEKRLKKLKKRAREAETKEEEVILDQIELSYEVKQLPALKCPGKISGCSILTQADQLIRICSLHNDNRITFYQSTIEHSIKSIANTSSFEELYSLSRPAHRAEVRCIALNSTSDQVISASADSIKVWHRSNGQCTMSIACDYALSLIIPPGDRHAIIGTKSGFLQLYDLGTGRRLENVEAHSCNETDKDTGIYSLCMTSDAKNFVSGGADKVVKFWNLELVEDEETGRGRRLSFIQDSKILKVADSITCLRCSKDGRFLAAATLDLKETIFYMDSLILIHELYGKSLPSTCMDFSYDGTVIATGGVDSIIRIFGTDFGDLRKMLNRTHEGGVTDLKFIANTHMFFTSGHDGSLKQWDADNFQRIITLEKHIGIVRCLSVCPKGNWVVSSGKDRYLRVWQKTNETLVLTDEREQERDKLHEEQELGAIQRPVVVGEKDSDAVRPSKSSFETEKAADQLLEAIGIFRSHIESEDKTTTHQLMTLVHKTDNPYKFVLFVLRKIKSSELEEAILMLPYNRVLELLVAVKGIVDRDWDIELSARVLIIAVRFNFRQLMATAAAIPILRALSKSVPNKLQNFQNLIGINYAALRHLRTRFEETQENQLFMEAATKVKDKRRKRKNKERNAKRALITI